MKYTPYSKYTYNYLNSLEDISAPERIRTSELRIRNPVLYRDELLIREHRTDYTASPTASTANITLDCPPKGSLNSLRSASLNPFFMRASAPALNS